MPGQLVHFEMPARDAARAKAFYEGLFGWSFDPSTGPVEYYEFSLFQSDESVPAHGA